MDKKQDPYICCLQETQFRPRHIQTESEKMENIFHENGSQEKAGVAILILDKIDLERKYCKR